VLSAQQALSIQLHPTRAQAQAGYRAGNPNYVDDWPKPELLCALTPFEVLAGLRTPRDAAALLRDLAVAPLAPLAADLDAATSPQALSQALAAILTWPDPEPLVGAVVAACGVLAASGGPYAAACAAAVREAGHHPGDLGVVAMLLMRHAVLAPGQAVFMPAGGLHAYLRGTGIETLANSDNVIRAGLTGKHVDVPELLKLLDPAVAVPVLTPAPLGDGVSWFDTPAPEFRLYVADLAAPEVPLPGPEVPLPGPEVPLPAAAPQVPLPAAGPRIALCTAGVATLRTETGETAKLPRGESVFIPAADGALRASGPARLFLAAPAPIALP
jgi:mannose-6-phosphate isomerase